MWCLWRFYGVMVISPPSPQNFLVYKALSHPLSHLSLLEALRSRQGSFYLVLFNWQKTKNKKKTCIVDELGDLPKVTQAAQSRAGQFQPLRREDQPGRQTAPCLLCPRPGHLPPLSFTVFMCKIGK